MTTATAVKLRVQGMDCGACAIKIENALGQLAGVSDINVSYGQESVALKLDAEQVSLETVESKIRALGFEPAGLVVPAAVSRPAPRAAWWRGRKARLTALNGLLLGAAFVVVQVRPDWSAWAYGAAALVGLGPVARRALVGARSGTPFGIETLMTIAAIGALAIGAAQEAAVVIFLFMVGELLETIAAGRARAGIEALMDLSPRTARREVDGRLEEVEIEALAIGDRVVVRPGDRVPVDGTVLEGASEVDESPVTGEAIPVAKGPGDAVHAGGVNTVGELRVVVERLAADNTIARIVRLVEEAQEAKAPTARLIDRFAAVYTPAAMVVALLVIIVPPLAFGAPWTTWIYRGLATLLIACPCALVISTPAAIASGLAAGARQGLLIKGGAALETLARIRAVAFDKTGTLTAGRPEVTDVVALGRTEDEVLARAAAAERAASHPLAQAIVRAAEARDLEPPASFGGAQATPGEAVTVRLRDGFVSVGSPRYAARKAELDPAASQAIANLEADGKTVVVLLAGRRVEGLIALRDTPRPDAAAAIARLKGQGLSLVMLTGDNRRAAERVAQGLDLEARAELLPADKLAAIAALKAAGPVAMVGDGINDAPALAAASVGVAMGGGADVALETADAALLGERVEGVADLVALARATLANIHQNIVLALGLKGVFLLTTLTGATSLWMAILADTGATVLVTANALRLLRRGRRGAA